MKTYNTFKCLVLIFSLDFIDGGNVRCDYRKFSDKDFYKYFVIPATWFDALQRCRLEGATLASPTTPALKNLMITVITGKNPAYNAQTEIFTGISATVSKGDFFTVGGTPLSALSAMELLWAENEPNNIDNDEDCIVLNSHGELLDKPCTETRPYICYHRDSPSLHWNIECDTVDTAYRLDNRTQRCYKFHTIPRNYSRAMLTCSAEGGHLAVANSKIEAQVLKELFDENLKFLTKITVEKKYRAYLGFHTLYEKLDFITVHGHTLEEAGYSEFVTGAKAPNVKASVILRCGALESTGLLNDAYCTSPHAFFCEKDPYSKSLRDVNHKLWKTASACQTKG